MDHSYIAGTNGACRKCGYNEHSHGDSVQCESCPRIEAIAAVIDGIMMCATCVARDIEIKAELAARAQTSTPKTRLDELCEALGKQIAQESREYFVKEVTAFVEIEAQVNELGLSAEDSKHEYAKIVESRIGTWKAQIFEVKKLEYELKVRAISDQLYLNQIVPTLRAAERETFKAYDINYKPTTVVATPKVSGPRMSASQRATESAAKRLNMSVEQYEAAMEKAYAAVMGEKCTCKETPGVCKVHTNA
jgi:3-oxoacyl-(acyl-carrier-protein) synthase